MHKRNPLPTAVRMLLSTVILCPRAALSDTVKIDLYKLQELTFVLTILVYFPFIRIIWWDELAEEDTKG